MCTCVNPFAIGTERVETTPASLIVNLNKLPNPFEFQKRPKKCKRVVDASKSLFRSTSSHCWGEKTTPTLLIVNLKKPPNQFIQVLRSGSKNVRGCGCNQGFIQGRLACRVKTTPDSSLVNYKIFQTSCFGFLGLKNQGRPGDLRGSLSPTRDFFSRRPYYFRVCFLSISWISSWQWMNCPLPCDCKLVTLTDFR